MSRRDSDDEGSKKCSDEVRNRKDGSNERSSGGGGDYEMDLGDNDNEGSELERQREMTT